MMPDSQPETETGAGTIQQAGASVVARIKTFLLPPALGEPAIRAMIHSGQNTSLLQSRERALTTLARIGSVSASVILVLGLFISDLGFALVWMGGLVVLGWVVALNRRIRYPLRVAMFVTIWLLVFLVEFVNYGLSVYSIVYLVAFCASAIMFGSARMAGFVLLSALLLLFGGGSLLIAGWFSPLIADELAIKPDWTELLSLTLVLAMVMAAFDASIANILRALDRALARELQARAEVERERTLLEHRVAERTRELSQAREQAVTANRYKTEFLLRVTHELRTPLGTILGYAELLQNGMLGPLSSQQSRVVQETVDSAYYLNGLIQDLLDGAQIERAQLDMVYAPFRPHEVVEGVCAMLRPQAEAKGLQLITHLAPQLPETLTGDRLRIGQILSNLVSNAINSTQAGTVAVRLDVPDVDHWRMQIADTGPGIPVEMQSTIFQPFWQIVGANTSAGGGLGLPIVKQLTRLMGGQITLDSTPGQGSTFAILFPFDLDPAGGTSPAPGWTETGAI
jgi:signal transduction histidine kinase